MDKVPLRTRVLNDDKQVAYGIFFLLLAFFLISFAGGWKWGVVGATAAGGILSFICAWIFLCSPTQSEREQAAKKKEP